MKLLKMIRSLALLCVIPVSAVADVASTGDAAPMTVYMAKKIITMDPALPEATAVAVSEGKIVAVGSLKTLGSWTKGRDVTIDDTFKGKIVMPGFIDPHVHPSLPAVLTQFDFLAPDDWSLPTGEFPGAKNNQDYIRQLEKLAAQHKDPSIPYIAWGYHPLWHGEVYREQLDELFPEQPVMLWHRSFHELVANTAALELLGVTEEGVKDNHEIDWAKGHFWELGLMSLMPKMPFLFAPQRYSKGMENFLEMMHQGGVTTALDMGLGIFGNPKQELEMIRSTAERVQGPSRIIMTPIVTHFIAAGKTPAQALLEIDEWRQSNSERVLIDKHFKLMMDGAIFSGLAQFDYPGYIDGHKGVWLAPVDLTAAWAQVFWDAGYKIHAHTNGDLSAAELIKIVRALQQKTPRVDHRFTLEHFAYVTEEQSRQMAALGMVVSANPYYQFMLSDVYADQWLGNDRARKMVPLGSLERASVPFALHSDSPMAPLSPLTLAQTAVERKTINGNTNHPLERISVERALQAITIDAAWIMGWEDRIGSIRAGKIADFTILNEDPYKVRADKLKDISIWGTVFEGKAYPILR